jgi:hypothetical protein
MKKPPKRQTSNGKWICCKDYPMPAGEDPLKWIHDYVKIGEYTYYDTFECTGCGHRELVRPKR